VMATVVDVWVYEMLKESKTIVERKGLFRLEPVILLIKKNRFRWYGLEDCEDDADWIKCCMVMGDRWNWAERKIWWDGVKEKIKSLRV